LPIYSLVPAFQHEEQKVCDPFNEENTPYLNLAENCYYISLSSGHSKLRQRLRRQILLTGHIAFQKKIGRKKEWILKISTAYDVFFYRVSMG
jgi:hypothetical protein